MVCIHSYYLYRDAGSFGGLPTNAEFTPRKRLQNFIAVFGTSDLVVYANSVTADSMAWLQTQLHASQIRPTTFASVLDAFRYTVQDVQDTGTTANCIVYFVDGFVVHAREAPVCIREGLDICDYVTPLDTPDKYVNSRDVQNNTVGGTLIWGGGEWTRVLYTPHSHWKYTYSASLVVAAKACTLTSDAAAFTAATVDRSPLLQSLWIRLQKGGRTLASTLPGVASWVYTAYMSPVRNWSKIVQDIGSS